MRLRPAQPSLRIFTATKKVTVEYYTLSKIKKQGILGLFQRLFTFLLIILRKRLYLVKIPVVKNHVFGRNLFGFGILRNDQKTVTAPTFGFVSDSRNGFNNRSVGKGRNPLNRTFLPFFRRLIINHAHPSVGRTGDHHIPFVIFGIAQFS